MQRVALAPPILARPDARSRGDESDPAGLAYLPARAQVDARSESADPQARRNQGENLTLLDSDSELPRPLEPCSIPVGLYIRTHIPKCDSWREQLCRRVLSLVALGVGLSCMRLVVLCGSLVALVAAQSETAAGPDQACLAACATTLAGFGACNLTTAATATPAQIACICAPSLLLVTSACLSDRNAAEPAQRRAPTVATRTDPRRLMRTTRALPATTVRPHDGSDQRSRCGRGGE